MNYITFILVLVAPLQFMGQTTADLDAKNGYKDITFDMPFDSLSRQIKFIKNTDYSTATKGVTAYSVKDQKYKSIGDIPVEPYFYIYENKIAYIMLSIKSWLQYKDEIIKVFTSLYGKPDQDKLRDPEFMWEGTKCRLMVSGSEVYNYVMIVIESKPTQALIEENEMKEAEKKAKEF